MSSLPGIQSLSYVLVTPARNEEAFIELTLRSMVAQTHPPLRWLIVSDGSTDATERIVRTYMQHHAWIDLLRVESDGARNFARKAHACNIGFAQLHALPFEVIGNIDADISFDEEHFSFLLCQFAQLSDLGVAGTCAIEHGQRDDYRFADRRHVPGSCQLFRRSCFEELGGYTPVPGGGIDWIAVTTARMNGWQTRVFTEKTHMHHRTMGVATHGKWGAWFRRGHEDYAMGSHPVWHVARCAFQTTARPYGIGGALLLAGYLSHLIHRAPLAVSPELARFHRAEQQQRLIQIGARMLGRPAPADRDADVSINESLLRLQRWIEAHDYKGYEPFDGLASPLRTLTLGNQFLQQVLLQIGRRSPFNIRPLLGIPRLESTKGRGYMAWGYLALLRCSGADTYRERARECLDWLIANKSPLYTEYSWGNHFDYASRAGTYAKHESIIVWTALIGQAFLDAYEMLGEGRYLEVADSICRWIMQLPRETTSTGDCLSYLAGRQLSVHNANLLGAAMLARTASHTKSPELMTVATAAIRYSCERQREDGSWWYAEGPEFHWIDNFHTAYNLDSIKCYTRSSGDRTFEPHLLRGWQFFKQTFFEGDGTPRYYHDRTYPIDIQCAAQAIETAAKLADDDPDALRLAQRVARWTIRNMQNESGYFSYRRYPLVVSRIPMLHWGQTTMFRALSLLSCELTQRTAQLSIAPASEQPTRWPVNVASSA